ncbi:MAG: hypothetical protein AB7H77_10360 [Bdellovibrionales bacterium]
MSAKPVEIYQGSDWLTYRWPVAQAFDTLDRIRELCLQLPAAIAAASTPGPLQPHHEIPDEDIAEIFGYIVELCDDLAGEIDIIHADLFSYLQGSPLQLWAAFEMRLHLRDLRVASYKEATSDSPLHTPPETILGCVARIRILLKQVDQ